MSAGAGRAASSGQKIQNENYQRQSRASSDREAPTVGQVSQPAALNVEAASCRFRNVLPVGHRGPIAPQSAQLKQTKWPRTTPMPRIRSTQGQILPSISVSSVPSVV